MHVLSQLNITRCSIIGHSDGGIVALRLAAANKIQLDKLVVIGAHWHLAENDPTRTLYESVTADDWRNMFPEEVALYEQLNPQADFNRLVTAVINMWLATGTDGYPGEDIQNITSALLVLRGDEDHLVSRLQATEQADKVKNAILANLPFTGHCPHEEQPELMAKILLKFLQMAD